MREGSSSKELIVGCCSFTRLIDRVVKFGCSSLLSQTFHWIDEAAGRFVVTRQVI